MKTVRIVNGVAVEVMVVPEGMTLADCYPAEIVKTCAEVDDAVELGWLTADGGRTFTSPPATLEPAVVIPDRCSKLGLKRALAETGERAIFPQPEWPAVKAAIASNADLQEDWDLATEIRRADPLVEAMIADRKYDDATVDRILVRAAALEG